MPQPKAFDSSSFYDHFRVYIIKVENCFSIVIGTKPPPKSSRIVDQLRLAIEYQRMLDSGLAVSQVQIAEAEGISRARVTQILKLNVLPDKIKDFLLSLNGTEVNQTFLTERSLRFLQKLPKHEAKIQAFQALLQRSGYAIKL